MPMRGRPVKPRLARAGNGSFHRPLSWTTTQRGRHVSPWPSSIRKAVRTRAGPGSEDVDVIGGRRSGGGASELLPAPESGGVLVVAVEGRGECVGRAVAGEFGDLGEGQVAGPQVVAGESHAPVGQVLHRGLTEGPRKNAREGRPGQSTDGGELGHRPGAGGVLVHSLQGRAE